MIKDDLLWSVRLFHRWSIVWCDLRGYFTDDLRWPFLDLLNKTRSLTYTRLLPAFLLTTTYYQARRTSPGLQVCQRWVNYPLINMYICVWLVLCFYLPSESCRPALYVSSLRQVSWTSSRQTRTVYNIPIASRTPTIQETQHRASSSSSDRPPTLNST